LDMLLYGNQQIDNQYLTVPHSGMKQREFVLYPLLEIAPDLILPCGEKLADLVLSCPLNGLQKMSHSVLI
jgi:2-amino-4-hydroxy-6-hydroxymethyldihydropteridine diphosphokinase